MQSGELFISSRNGVYMIRVTGRATFECAPVIRNLAKTLERESFKEIRIDLKECQWMDSTFMGVLAMLGLQAKKINAGITVCNAGEQNTELLCGLGLRKLFKFVTEDTASADDSACKVENSVQDDIASARTVLDAHETLMNVDEDNVRKFGGVVSLVKQDLERKQAEENGKN